MGCCISSTNTTKRGPSHPKPPSRHHHSPPQPDKPNVTATRTPSPLEEETVKEVLSEIPIILKPQKNTPVTTITQTQEPKILTQKNNKKHQDDQEISQASEICSNITDTLSTVTATTTTTITEIREDEVTSKKRVNKSPAKVPKKRPHTGDRERVPKPPAKTSGQVIRTAAGQRNVGSSGVRRDFGRSPGTRTAGGVGRGRVGASPGKAGGRSVERKKNVESENGAVLRQQQNESLEIPLVSLECFIFV